MTGTSVAAEFNPFTSATDMLAALDAGTISSRELVELHIERIERHNPQINVIVTKNYEGARDAARRADEARAAGNALPLAGLPMTIKDQIDVAGLRTTGGNPDRAEHRAESDAPNVARLRAAGAIIIGKTNVPNTGDWQASNPLFGRTNNPVESGYDLRWQHRWRGGRRDRHEPAGAWQ